MPVDASAASHLPPGGLPDKAELDEADQARLPFGGGGGHRWIRLRLSKMIHNKAQNILFPRRNRRPPFRLTSPSCFGRCLSGRPSNSALGSAGDDFAAVFQFLTSGFFI